MSDQQDARQHPRKHLEVTVDWQLLGEGDVMWSATDDVGPGGLRIRTLAPPEKDSRVVVVLGPPGRPGGPLRVPARVVWTRMDDEFCGMGVSFEPQGGEEQVALAKVLGQLTDKPSGGA